MNCAPYRLEDYILSELNAAERSAVEAHAADCAGCQVELERLRITRAALLSAVEEELPRRIAFVSDKVFEPRWWQKWRVPAPVWGFASAAMLSGAILVHAYTRPHPQMSVAPSPAASELQQMVERKVEQELDRRVTSAMRLAIAEMEERQAERTHQLVNAAVRASEKRVDLQRRGDLLAIESAFDVFRRKLTQYHIASNEAGRQ